MDSQFNSLLFKRHSIRRYKPESLPAESVKKILEAALLSPTSKSSRPWEFIAVDDKDTLAQLAQCKPFGAKPIAGAALAVVVCADPEKSDVYVEDCSVAASFMQLQAAALEIGSCWIQVRNRLSADDEPAENLIKATLGIPANLSVVMVLTFGISDEDRKPVDPSKLLWEKVHIGAYTNDAD